MFLFLFIAIAEARNNRYTHRHTTHRTTHRTTRYTYPHTVTGTYDGSSSTSGPKYKKDNPDLAYGIFCSVVSLLCILSLTCYCREKGYCKRKAAAVHNNEGSEPQNYENYCPEIIPSRPNNEESCYAEQQEQNQNGVGYPVQQGQDNANYEEQNQNCVGFPVQQGQDNVIYSDVKGDNDGTDMNPYDQETQQEGADSIYL